MSFVILIYLLLMGMALGSFVNALILRLRKQELLQETGKKVNKKQYKELSISQGRSMCTHCKHPLAPKDLVPVFSWVWLRGRCRYCKKPIEDTPLPELILPLLFLVSYLAWPYTFNVVGPWMLAAFISWLLLLTCFLALTMYDAKWYILPNRLVVAATILSLTMVISIAFAFNDFSMLRDAVLSGALFFGFFYVLFAVSNESWIGGGDVKLAFSLGLIVGSPIAVAMTVFFASLLGTLIALPGIIKKSRSMQGKLPFGPLLIIAATGMFLWGETIISWYLGA